MNLCLLLYLIRVAYYNRTVFNMLKEIIPSDLRMDPGFKPLVNGEPWFFDDYLSTDIQVKNQFKQVDRNRFSCLDFAHTQKLVEETAELERLPTKQASSAEIVRDTQALAIEPQLSNLDFGADERNEQDSLASSQEFLDYVDKMSVSSGESQIMENEDHGDLYEGFPPEFM